MTWWIIDDTKDQLYFLSKNCCYFSLLQLIWKISFLFSPAACINISGFDKNNIQLSSGIFLHSSHDLNNINIKVFGVMEPPQEMY